ncbi:phosphoadenosine phosphosulfate reductase family protein [Clostridium cochlearium]|uniref:Phosphoadenosine phosphosulfate reductase n=1 Tax=Clostridium cochlearium TaxID=1494 RepID=A0A1G9HDU6_CLOCO|nr:phosphoadenosine phosphosulfate reductase family protein [Clostridium cochlearium]MBE6063816.1 phosphoadenosine phosphosulfate reductase [Clostridium cochlearium]NOH15410.1 phosphoadenosine phosphosulfate reductase family protein [Clostridium cochlearium]SDL11228.1 phosphoadenosine phosphosulfate reductase [Clostridium cochlearium]
MLSYYCKNCKLESKTSKCTICGNRTEMKSKIYYCKKCNIPIYDEKCTICGEKGTYLSTDVRPVFPEERLMLEILLDEPFKYKNSSIWNISGSKYIIDGEKLNITLDELMTKKPEVVIKQLEENLLKNSYDKFNEIIQKFIKANKDRFNFIVTEATEFIKKCALKYDDDEMFVSFSGGKDSTVVHDLVVKALSNPNIIHIFGDTTLEFPLTLEYIKRFKKINRQTPLLVAKNKEKNFMNVCQVVGPPSRLMRWCCTIFKTGAISRKINIVFKDKKRLLTFYGIRRSESSSRNKYERESESPKITKQKVVSPIIDWNDFDVWLYILTSKIDFNDAYRFGYSRVGCWCCPNNSTWAQYLANIYMPEEYTKWRNFLIDFANKIGKPDPEVYVDSGNWKARQGGNGLKISENTFVKEFEPCATGENIFNYELKRPITDQLYEFFKPFGWINKELGNQRLGEVYIIDKNNNPVIRLQGRKGKKILKVSILKLPIVKAKNIRDAKLRIECQLTKYQLCVGCLGCESVCRFNAINIKKNVKNVNDKLSEHGGFLEKLNENIYEIDDNKCVRCGECINHFDGGCYMRKVLITRRGD